MAKSLNFKEALRNGFFNIMKNYKIVIALVIFIIITGPLAGTGNIKRSLCIMFEQMGYTIVAVISLSLVVGFLGELSLGHAAFMSIGAFIGMYAQSNFFPQLATNMPLLSLILAMIIGGIAAAIAGVIVGLPALRLKGDYLAIVTLAFGEIVKIVFQNIDAFGGAIGFTNDYRYSDKKLFIVCFVVAILAIILVKNILKSKHGRAIMAIRDNEIAARAMGINAVSYKLIVFIISAALAGVAGVLFGASKFVISSTTFDYNYSINNILVMVVIGGMGNINGSIISAVAVTFINIKLQTILTGGLAPLKNIIYAVILIGIVMYNNAPALKGFRSKYNLTKLYKLITVKIRKIIYKDKFDADAKQQDYGADWSNIQTKINMDAIVTTDFEVTTDPNTADKGGK